MRRRLWVHIRRVMLALLLALLAMQLWYGAHLWWYRDHEPEMTSFMARGLERLRENDPRATLYHRYLPYEHISMHVKRAVTGAEDSKFVRHHGFDLEGIRHALAKNRTEGEPVAGGSTISQQLAKNLFLSGSRSYFRKGQEALITLQLEILMSKRRILELYLNYAEWGTGVYGVEAASRHYFGVSAGQLSAWQAARLAAMLPKPRFYQKYGATPWLDTKTGIILRRMPRVEVP